MKTIFFIGVILFFPFTAHAETFAAKQVVDTTNELWLASGFISYHFQTDKQLRNDNAGLGLEYRYSPNSAIAVGRFNNSDWQTTRYLAWQYQPIKLGPINFGAAIGLFDGYPKVNKSGWFVAVIPALSLTHKRFGANLAVVPTYRDKLHGSISLQLKFKLL